MEKTYKPQDIEQPIYEYWENQGYFKPHGDLNKESFCIMIPPPNVTGRLHMGHAFQQTIIDIIIRYQRMRGKNTLWQTGTDHAGIATQMLVERKIANEENKTRQEYGREAFIEKVWQWKIESGNNISCQMRRLGLSVDWERERFTMDDGMSNSVKEVFIQLYKENFIYQGKRLVNWDPKLCTAISDLEVENREIKGSMWYIRYPLADKINTIDGKNYLIVATTRPETLLGDTGLAVHPEDIRYNYLIGKEVILPLVNRRIQIIGDKYVDIKKGTGCVKITPAHDFNDYEIARRHKLQIINILTFNGHIREKAEVFDSDGNSSNIYKDIPVQFQKMERFNARKNIVAELNNLGLLEKIESHILTVPYGDRSGVIIEPMITNQWYLRTSLLAKTAIEVVKNGNIQFLPKQYKNMYFSWMHNVQDWCISRQLWWGHRIPAWYDKNNNIYVGHSEERIRKENNLENEVSLLQDDDVLDTWFSSAIWTFSTLGWPKDTESLRVFHPTNVLVSGFDIIFFWIARMIMLTMHFMKDQNGRPQVPFKTVFITGLVRDEDGQKMSKSRGNVIDPLDMVDGISLEKLLEKRTSHMMQPHLVEKIRKHTIKQFPNGILAYGTDALRFTLAAMASTGRDINWDMNRLEGYRNFCNKLWNASRFVIMNNKNQDCCMNSSEIELSLVDRWILSEVNDTVQIYREALDNYRFDMAVNILYDFIWNQFCDWYLEMAKLVISNGSEVEIRATRSTLVTVLELILRLAHPIIPFITENIWQRVKMLKNINSNTIMLQKFPQYNPYKKDINAKINITWIKQIIVSIRNIRSDMNILKTKLLDVMLYNCSVVIANRVKENHNLILHLAKLNSLSLITEKKNSPLLITKIIGEVELLIPMTDLKDKESEQKRLGKEIAKLDTEIEKIKAKIHNEKFTLRAPKSIVIKVQKHMIQLERTKLKLIQQRDMLI